MPAVDRSAQERSYLSIREVLELLVGEFPDVTISKIRFLESRGLIHPERTPSGYRKFYEADVERLRWILLQQRENFLPLKVIKGRLERGSARNQESSEPSLFDSVPLAAEQRLDSEPTEEPRRVETTFGGGGGGDEPPRPFEPRSDRVVGRPIVPSSNGASRHVEGPDQPHLNEHSNASAPTKPRAEDKAAQASANAAERETKSPESPSVTATTAPTPAPEDVPAAVAAAAAPATSARPARSPKPTERTVASSIGDVSLSAGELAGAAGSTPELVETLIEFGLIESRTVAGEATFDATALEVTKLAASFGRFGIEPRHLRSLKHAAERQAALYAQVVTPLLRQRNPASRDKARTDLEELTSLGASLTSIFLGGNLREITGG